MKGAAFLDLIARAFPAANSFRMIGVTAGLAVTVAVTAITQGPAVVHWLTSRGASAQAKADAKLIEAGAAIGADTATQLAEHGRETARITATTQEGADHVLSAAGASTPAPDVARALRDALCLSPSYATEPDCGAVRADRAGVGPAGADPGGAPPDGR